DRTARHRGGRVHAATLAVALERGLPPAGASRRPGRWAELDPRGGAGAGRNRAGPMTASSRGTVRIAAGQGFWGDWLEAPVRQVRGGPIDYLMLDYLAEVTMSILQKQKSRDPNHRYARDFVPLMERILTDLIDKRFRVISNAGGVNPRACAEAVIGGA